jgi:hypothetical protein
VSETNMGSGLYVGPRSDVDRARPAQALAHNCHICDLTPLGHGLFPIVGTLIAFVALVFGCR